LPGCDTGGKKETEPCHNGRGLPVSSLAEGSIEPSSDLNIKLATFDQYRSLLFSIAYRMLGGVADAEDMLQETFIRWQQSDEDNIRSPRSFLVTIISHLCINYLQSARVQREEYVGQWLPEPLVTDPGNDPFGLINVDESLSMAFLLLLERLTPIERAVFLLREVFEYEYQEIASILRQSESNCRQILRRAKQHVTTLRPRFEAPEEKQDALLRGFLHAVETGDAESLLTLLSSDVVLHSDGGGKAIAVPNPVRGAGNVVRGILGAFERFVPKTLVRRFVHVNGDAGFVNYLNGKPHSVITIATQGRRIHAIYIVTNPEKLMHLPALTAEVN
jgi:RNA polymerase sigma-70 factor, ECF subfamily